MRKRGRMCLNVLLASTVGLAAGHAHGQVRLTEWNVTGWELADVGARGAAFQTAFYGITPGGLQMAPDIVVAQEMEQSGGTGQANVNAFRDLLNTAAGSPGDWAAAPFVVNGGAGGGEGNALFYRTSKIVWISTATLNANTGTGANQAPRDNQRWLVRLVGYNSVGAQLYIYGGHFKAGDTSGDQARRNPEATRIRNDTNAITTSTPGARFVLCGDFNIQDSAQLAYQYLVGSGAGFPVGDPRLIASGRFFDPINTPGNWNNNGAFRNVHTQEPGSMMDDRHDQILISSSLTDGTGLDYIGNINIPYATVAGAWDDPNHSYRCWGNDGNHFNQAINSGTNTQVGPTIAGALVTTVGTGSAGGHLPVFLDMKVPARYGGPTGTIDFGTVAQNAVATMTIQISNAADVPRFSRSNVSAQGIDALSYTLSASAGFTAPGGTFTRSATLAPAATNSHVITMNTSSMGNKNGTLTIASNDPEAPSIVIALTGVVGVGGPPAGNYDVNGNGIIDNDDIYAWFGLFTDVNGDSMVDVNDLNALRTYLRFYEVTDMTTGRR